jgi:hypothetical protein
MRTYDAPVAEFQRAGSRKRQRGDRTANAHALPRLMTALHPLQQGENDMAEDGINSFMTGPDEQGRFGMFGGRFVSETLMPLILDLEERIGCGSIMSGGLRLCTSLNG